MWLFRKSFFCILFMQFSSLIVLSWNKENSCGCSIGRTSSDKVVSNSIFINYKNDQCPLNLSETPDHENSDVNKEMIYVPGGEYQFGTDDIVIEADREGPSRIVKIHHFYLDRYEVSNRDFKIFTESTGYRTEAENFGDSFVFSLFLNESFKDQLKDFRVVQAPWWYKVFGANWRHPHGPDSQIEDLMDHPAVHISWTDAQEYCKWRGSRLPTEAEWEAACRGGHKNTKYPWGNTLYPNKMHKANIWQGSFPHHNSEKDGYLGTNPVHLFPQNDFDFHNMAGNVWEWTQDSWSKDNPKEKVKKGGSYLCHRSYCYRYRCSARSHNTEDSSAGNLGFRCAKGA